MGKWGRLVAMDEFWQDAADQLGELFALMPGVDPLTLGKEAQSVLASYKPPEGLWEDSHHAQRKRFAEMERRMFETIYMGYLHPRKRRT